MMHRFPVCACVKLPAHWLPPQQFDKLIDELIAFEKSVEEAMAAQEKHIQMQQQVVQEQLKAQLSEGRRAMMGAAASNAAG